MIPQVLAIAGSDPGGGAGIQADSKAIEANGGFALTVVTSVTAQNTKGVSGAFDLPVEVVDAQLRAVFDDFEVSAVKTGMLAGAATVRAVARILAAAEVSNLIVDPVLMSKGGFPLIREDGIEALRLELLPHALLVTPNRHEAFILSKVDVTGEARAREAGLRILETGCRAVLIKGGHIDAPRSTDYLITERGMSVFPGERIDSPHTHGTGCILASAIATWIARGRPLDEAVFRAKEHVTEAIRHGLAIGHGSGPADSLWFLRGSETGGSETETETETDAETETEGDEPE